MSNETESFEDDRPAEMKLQHDYGLLLSSIGSCNMNWELHIPDCYKSNDGKWQYDWRIAVRDTEMPTFPATETKNDAQRGILAVFDLQRETADISGYYCTAQEYTLLCGLAALFGLKPKVWEFEDIPIQTPWVH